MFQINAFIYFSELWRCITNIQYSYPWKPVSPLVPSLGILYEINFSETKLLELCLKIADHLFYYTIKYRPACKKVIKAFEKLLAVAVDEKLCYSLLKEHFQSGNCRSEVSCAKKLLFNIMKVADVFDEALMNLKLAARRLCCTRPRLKASTFPSCVTVGLVPIVKSEELLLFLFFRQHRPLNCCQPS